MLESNSSFQPGIPNPSHPIPPTADAHGETSETEVLVHTNQVLTVLVIEDDDVDFMHVSRSLRKGTPTLLLSHANSFGAAVKELQLRQFDVIIADLHLPDATGPALVKRLREYCHETPILVLTSLNDESVEHEILESGAQDFLPKGAASGNWLRKAIVHAVQRQQAVNEINRATEHLQTSHHRLRQQAELREEENRKLERLYQTAHEFLAKASHDIRSPLSVIKEHVAIVRDGLVGPVNPEQVSMLEKAIVRADDVNSKLQDLLDSSKLDSGLLDICRRACHINEIVDQIRDPLHHRAIMRKIDLEIVSEFRTPMAFCDEQKAARVLSGLAVNAINACGEAGHVNLWVRHEPREQEIRIGVTDDGIGISPDHRDRLQARFDRSGLMTEPDDKVLGLGLSIAARFCRINLGALHVTSEVGLGSVFWFGVPTVGSTRIFPRWLELQTAPTRYIHLHSFRLPEKNNDRENRDNELLVTYLAESDELLFQSSPCQWWLASGSPYPDRNVRITKANNEIERLTSARAASPDFRVQIESKAVWDIHQPPGEMIAAFQEITHESADNRST